MSRKGAFPLELLRARNLLLAGLLLIGLSVALTPALWAQEPIALRSIAPDGAYPGDELDLRIEGRGFADAERVEVLIAGVDVLATKVEADGVIAARVRVPADAQPGPRAVEVLADFGPNETFGAGLPDAFTILEPREPTPNQLEPDPDSADEPLLALGTGVLGLGLGLGAALVFAVVAFLVGRTSAPRPRLSWERQALLEWQAQAETELPEPRQACTWTCQAAVERGMLDLWQVEALVLTPFSAGSRKGRASARCVISSALEELNAAAERPFLEEDRLRQMLTPTVDALLSAIEAWSDRGQSPAAVRVGARVSVEVSCTFTLHHCEPSPSGLTWVERATWKRPLHQPGGERLGVLRGPAAGERAFPERAREELIGMLLALVRSCRLWRKAV